MNKLTNYQRRTLIKYSAFISGLAGIVILIASIWPIVDYKLKEQTRDTTLLKPMLMGQDGSHSKVNNWLPDLPNNTNFETSKVVFYTITISRLKIENAMVVIGGEDLSKHLIHYPGTALPGKKGNAVIFGHSVLPIFYNPKKYEAIFSTLPTLKRGDDVFINYDGVSYKYIVEDLFEIFPSDIQILEQNTSDSFISLVTCVPPGDPRNPKRLIVRARIGT